MAITLNDVRSIGDPLRQYNATLTITSIPGGVGNGEAIAIAVTTHNIPGSGVTSFESTHHGHVIKHAGRGIHPRILTVEYEERSDLSILKSFVAWKELQWNTDTGEQADSSAYKTEGILDLFSHDGSIVGHIKLRGMYIEEISDVPLDGAADDSVKISINFSYDNWVLE